MRKFISYNSIVILLGLWGSSPSFARLVQKKQFNFSPSLVDVNDIEVSTQIIKKTHLSKDRLLAELVQRLDQDQLLQKGPADIIVANKYAYLLPQLNVSQVSLELFQDAGFMGSILPQYQVAKRPDHSLMLTRSLKLGIIELNNTRSRLTSYTASKLPWEQADDRIIVSKADQFSRKEVNGFYCYQSFEQVGAGVLVVSYQLLFINKPAFIGLSVLKPFITARIQEDMKVGIQALRDYFKP